MPFTNWKSLFSTLANKYETPAPTVQDTGTAVATSSGSTTNVQATADAIGTDTFAQINTSLSANDTRGVTITQGAISATAAAQSTAESPAYASTYVGASMPEADLVFYQQSEGSASGSSGDSTWATSSSSLNFLAIDFKFLDLSAPKVWASNSTNATPELSLSGNLAAFNTNVSASGANTLASVEQSSLVVEDQFSTVSVSATTAADDSPPNFSSFFNLFF